MAEDYWGDGYWGLGFWATGFWGQGGTVAPPTPAPPETVEATLPPRRQRRKRLPLPYPILSLIREWLQSE